MNLSQFYNVAKFLVDSYDKGGVEASYQQVLSALQAQISSPGQAQLEGLSSALEQLRKAVIKANYSTMTPTWKLLVDELDLANFVGDVIYSKPKRHITESGPILTEALTIVQTDFNLTQQSYNYLRQAKDALKYLEYPFETLEEGESELLIELPRALFENQVSDFASRLKLFDQIVSTCAEVATGSPEKLILKEISTTDPIIVALATPATVLFVLKVVNQILDAYKKVVEIREMQEKAKAINLKPEIQKSLLAESESRINESIEAFLIEIKRERKINNALSEKLKKMTYKLAALIDHGARVEGWARLSKQAEEEEAEIFEARNLMLSEIQNIGGELRKFRANGDPILNLPPPKDEDDIQ